MGTQQILLIVVGVIIVGIAITVGTIPAFHKGMANANKEAVTQDCLRFAAAAQGYFRRPGIYGGGNNSFNNIAIEDVGLADNGSGLGENNNGEYEVDGSAGSTCTIIGYSSTEAGATVTVVVHLGRIDNPVYDGWSD